MSETALRDLIKTRIAIFDGAMGTMIQSYDLDAKDTPAWVDMELAFVGDGSPNVALC